MKVRIYKPHTHAGVRYEPGPEGLEIDIPAHDVEFLNKHTDVSKRPGSDKPAPDPVPFSKQ